MDKRSPSELLDRVPPSQRRPSRLYIAEALDSRHVALSQHGKEDFQTTVLRLRLHVLSRILLGDRILVPEGWSLDSLPFLAVQKEVLDAWQIVQDEFGATRDERPDFFQYERRDEGGYLDTFLRYLHRDDCAWSGFPHLAEDRVTREALGARLIALRASDALTEDNVTKAFYDALANESVARAIATAFQHAGLREDYVLSRVTPIRTPLLQLVAPDLRRFCALQQERLTAAEHNDLARWVDLALDDALITANASSLIRFARNELGGLGEPVAHIVRTNYMRMAAEGAQAVYSGPVLPSGQSSRYELAEAALGKSVASPDLVFGGALKPKDPAFVSLSDLESWQSVWQSVFRLLGLRHKSTSSADEGYYYPWAETVQRFRRDLAQPFDWERVANMQSFQTMEAMLAEHCPQLVIAKSLGSRLGLGVTTTKTADKILGQGIVTILISTIDAGASMALAGALKTAELVGKNFVSEKVTPLGTTYGLQSSVFRVFAS